MKARWLPLVIIFGIAAIAVGWIYQSQSRSESASSATSIPDNIDYYLTHLNYRTMTKAGNLNYEFQSIRLEHHNLDDISHITRPSLQIYRNSEFWQVDSILGMIEHQSNLLRLEQQVVMLKSGDKALKITSESIRFEPDRDLVISDSGVIVTTATARIKAEAASLNLADKIYSFKKTRAIYHNENS